MPFPYDIIQSNTGWAVVRQTIGSVPRMQGPFSEPSALAGYMTGITVAVDGGMLLYPDFRHGG